MDLERSEGPQARVARSWRRFAAWVPRAFADGGRLRWAASIRMGTLTRRLLVGLAVVGLAAGVMAPGEQSATAVGTRVGTAVSTTTGPAHSLLVARVHPVVKENSWQHDALSSHAPQNWYRFTLSSPSYVYTQLGTLPADYNLRLYDSAGKKLLSSDHAKKQVENVSRTLAAGTYFVRVAASHGAYAKAKYALLVRIVPTSAGVGALTAHVGNYNIVVGEMVNVSSDWISVADFDVYLYGSNGKLLHRYLAKNYDVDAWPWVRMPPGTRAPFKISLISSADPLLDKTSRVVVVPYASVQKAGKRVSLTTSALHRVYHHRNGLTWVDFSTKVHNPSKWTLPYATAYFEARDSRGVLVGLAITVERLPGHATKTFGETYDNWHSGLTFGVQTFQTANTA